MLTKPQNITEYLKDKSIMVQVHFHEHTWIHYLLPYCYDQTIFELSHRKKESKYVIWVLN